MRTFLHILSCLVIMTAMSFRAHSQNHKSANYDESKVPEYTLPPLLICNDGTPVTSVSQWEETRRPELMEMFLSEVYGRLPQTELQMDARLLAEDENALGGLAVCRQVELTFRRDTSSRGALLLLYLPKLAESPVPVFMMYNFRGNHSISTDPSIIPSRLSEYPRGDRQERWPLESIVSSGYGLATMHYFDIYPDKKGEESYAKSVLPLLYGPGEVPGEDGGQAIAAWAWGYSRILDYLETLPEVDASKVIVAGHSRLGKTALWAGAADSRFAIVVSNDSGCGGAAISRRQFGETVNQINKSFPHWFCRNFRKYALNEGELPIDQHGLLALVAPRPLYVASASEDLWADPVGERLSAYLAGEVYGIYGYVCLSSPELPAVETPEWTRIGNHLRGGPHNITAYDWSCYISFADMWLR